MPTTGPHFSDRTLRASREEDARAQRVRTVDAMVQRIRDARAGLDRQIAELQIASNDLRTECRRNFDEASSSFLVFANSHIRLAGALSQGVRRTASMDRMLVNAAADREEAKVRQEALRVQQQVRSQARQMEQLQAPSDDDFDLVFGEVVNDAAQ